MKKNLKVNKEWTLFLDRDGVINTRLIDDYVKSSKEFEIIQGVLPALNILNSYFGRIVIVSNQQGVGKGLMSDNDLKEVTSYFLNETKKHNIKIDKVYYCTKLAQEKSKYRKPNTGMAYQAKDDFPEINFRKSVMVGDSISDMQFGKKVRMKNVFIAPENEASNTDQELFDYNFETLQDFAFSIEPK